MTPIDNAFLDSLGLQDVPADEKQLMIADIQETLAERIGSRAEGLLDEAKLDELDKVAENNPAGVKDWLYANLPNYQQVVEEEVAKIKEEILSQVPGILAQIAEQPSQTQNS